MLAHRLSLAPTLAVAIVTALACAGAQAGTLNYTLYTGVEHSDNIALSSSDPVSGNTLIPGATFSFDQQGEDLQAHALGSFEYRDYFGSRYTNQTQAQLSGQANWTIAPKRLDFALEDYASVEPVDPTVSNAPANQQQTNVLSLGPTLRFDLAPTWHGQADLRYIDSRAQKTKQFDSRRGELALSLVKDFTHASQGSLNAQTQKVNYTSAAPDSDYRVDQLYARYQGNFAHGDLDISAGGSRLHFDQGSPRTLSGSLLRASGGWRPTETQTLALSLSREYTDAAQSMMGPTVVTPVDGGTGIATGHTVIGAQVYLQRLAELTYAVRTGRTTLSAAPYYRELSYIGDQTYDQRGHGLTVGLDYKLRPTLTLSAYGTGERLRYKTLDRLDRTTSYEVALVDQRTPHWSWRVSFLHQQRHSDAVDQGFHENRIYVGVIFTR